MTRVRARWLFGSSLWFGALALSCGSGDTENLFTQPSTHGGESSAGASNQAGATHVGGGGASGSGNAGGSSAGGAAHAGATGHAGAATGGAPDGGAPSGGAPSGGAAHGGAPSGGAPGAGAPGAGAPSGGASGNAGAGGSMAGSAGTSGGGGGAGTCVDNSACADDEYCAKTSCMAKAEGHCTKSPTDCGNTKVAVVCGCDGVTYHDACLLHQARQNANALDSGACAKAAEGTVQCTASNSTSCTGHGGVCGFRVENACLATMPDFAGICWVLPASCPGSDPGTADLCVAAEINCVSECSAIKGGQRYAMSDHCN